MSQTGTPHLQGYTVFSNPMSMEGAKSLIDPNAHLEPRRGSHQAARDYCQKIDDPTFLEGPWTFGTEPEQGRRSDLETLGNRILSGEKADSVILEAANATAFRNQKALQGLQLIVDRHNIPLWRYLRVIWFWGPSGYGKDRRAIFECTRMDLSFARITFAPQGQQQWFDGYDGQQAIIMSDFKGFSDYASLLAWLDGHPLQLPIKGSFKVALYTFIFVTAIDPPAFFYPSNNKELLRRITDIVEFKKPWIPIGPQQITPQQQ